MKTYEIGNQITFTTQTGETIVAEVSGRNWWGDNVASYIVRTADYKNYNVSAVDFVSGHAW